MVFQYIIANHYRSNKMKISKYYVPNIHSMFRIREVCLFSSALIILIITGCVPQQQINSLDRRVNGLSVENATQAREISELRHTLNTLKNQPVSGGDTQDIETLRSSLADTAGRVEQIQAELMRINGQLEQMAQSNADQKAAFAKFRDDTTAEIERLRQEIQILQKSSGITGQIGKSSMQAARGEVDLYQQALDLFKDKKYREAKKTLKKYVDTHPNGAMVPNAHFWMGECEYHMGRYEEAILEYQTVISKFPKSNKLPDALLKQGLSFAKLGDKESARIVLSKLVKKFPKSPQASVASKQLRRLR